MHASILLCANSPRPLTSKLNFAAARLLLLAVASFTPLFGASAQRINLHFGASSYTGTSATSPATPTGPSGNWNNITSLAATDSDMAVIYSDGSAGPTLSFDGGRGDGWSANSAADKTINYTTVGGVYDVPNLYENGFNSGNNSRAGMRIKGLSAGAYKVYMVPIFNSPLAAGSADRSPARFYIGTGNDTDARNSGNYTLVTTDANPAQFIDTTKTSWVAATDGLTSYNCVTANVTIDSTNRWLTFIFDYQGTEPKRAWPCVIQIELDSGCTPPAINTQPSAQSDCEGEQVQFSVAATGTTLSYQWRKNGVDLTDGGNISGATTDTLTIDPVGTGDAATAGSGYDCVVTEGGACSTTSDRVALAVNTAPAIATQPANDSVAVGANAHFSIVGTGAGLAYQWQVNTGSGFVDVSTGSGADTDSYTTEETTSGMDGYQYRCVVSGTCSPEATSDAATLTVTSCTAAGVVADPSNQTVTSPATASFTVTASGSDPTYQWEVSADSGGSWNPVSGGTGGDTASYTTPATTGAMNGYQYRCVVSVACDSSSVPSQPATLTVNCDSAAITADPEDVIAGLGATASFTVVATGSPTLSCQWEVSTDDGGTWNNVSGGSGGTSASYTTPATTLADDGNQYRCVVTSSCDSSTDTSAAATLTVVNPATLQFRSAQTGDWGNASTWEILVGATWQEASASPTSGNDTITIRDTHVVTVSANVTADQITVESGGTLTIAGSSTKLTVASGTGTDLEVSGILNITGGSSALTLVDGASVVVEGGGLVTHNGSSSGFVSAGTGSTITFASGAKYQHLRDGGRIPISTWNAGSICEVVVAVTDPSSLDAAFLNQAFHHFVWTSTSQTSDEDLRGALTTINGDLTINANTGKIRLNSSSGTSTLTIGGNLIVNTGTLNCNSTTTLVGMNLGGNLTIASGATIDVTGGTTYTIAFNGSAPQTWTMAGSILNATRYAWKINSGSTVTLNGTVTVNSGSQVGSITVDGTLVVASGSVIGGTGTFTLNSGSTLAGEGTVNFASIVNGTLAPGSSIGTLHFGNDLTFAGGSTADFEVNNSGGTKTSDLADASGQTVTYGGTLKLTYSGDTLLAGDSFTLFNASAFAGSFTGLELVNWPNSALRVDLGSLASDGSISIAGNSGPSASNMELGVVRGGANGIAIGKLASDVDGDLLSVMDPGAPAHGTVQIANGSLVYTHDGGSATNDSFTVTVTDPSGLTASAVVSVTVTASTGNAPNITGLSGAAPSVTVNFLGMPNATYAIERTENLVDWTEVSAGVATGSNGRGSFTDESAPNPGPAYYRTRHVP